MKKIILLLIIVAAAVGFFTNPTEAEAKQQVKTTITNALNDKMSENLNDKESSVGNKVGSALGLMFGSKLVDLGVDVNVKNYYVFTSFEAKTRISSSDDKPLASGIILFGKVIPFSVNDPTK